MLEKSLSFCCEYAAIIWQAAIIQRSLFCQTNFVPWVFATTSEYIANNYCEQCSSQNIRSIFIRYSHKDSFSVRACMSLSVHAQYILDWPVGYGTSEMKNGYCVNTLYTLLKTLQLKSSEWQTSIYNPSLQTSSHHWLPNHSNDCTVLSDRILILSTLKHFRKSFAHSVSVTRSDADW